MKITYYKFTYYVEDELKHTFYYKSYGAPNEIKNQTTYIFNKYNPTYYVGEISLRKERITKETYHREKNKKNLL